MRKLLLLFVCVCASIGAWAVDLTRGGSYTVDGGVVTFSGTTAGAIAGENSFNFNGATRIKFDNTCQINKADLECFLKENKYYVDLFDITNGTSYDQIITEAVDDMVTNSWQAKGLILPFNTGIGTSVTERKNNSNLPTFSQYVTYYRSGSRLANIYVYSMASYYHKPAAIDTQDNNTQNQLDTAISHLLSHNEVTDSENGVEIFMVGTNNVNKFDLSALPSDKTTIEIVGDEWVKQENIGLADIYVFASEAGHLHDAVSGTGINDTPCNLFVVSGPVNGNDVQSINDFNNSAKEGPHVYKLYETTGAKLGDFKAIINEKVEYIVLPSNLATEQIVASDFSETLNSSTNFKAAIAPSVDKTKLSAYVKEAGSLGMARCYATGGSFDNIPYNPNKTNLTDVILAGSLNAADICAQIKNSQNPPNPTPYIDSDGHWSSTYSPNPTFGLNQEYSISTLDLENAIFANNYDMNFFKASLQYLTTVKLPKSQSMERIPAYCFELCQSLSKICIPYNYKYIEDGAFDNTILSHITTTDASYAEIDNGPLSYTFSANLQRLGIKPEAGKSIATQVFPHEQGVTEIYCLATKTPECYRGVFPANACYGYGGQNPQMPYCRDRYFNGGDAKNAFAVLRYPSKASYDAVTDASKKDGSYEQMQKNYTDVLKVYTKIEQTGAVDANGKPITWPTREECNRVYTQATFGYVWTDWNVEYDDNRDHIINGGENPASWSNNTHAYSIKDNNYTVTGNTGFNENYAGWHQIVLTQATYVDPTEEINEQEEIVRNYENAGLYTFCIPYDMTIDEVIELLGVPVSDDSKKIVNMFDKQKVTAENGPIMPKIYQLESVTRYRGSSARDNNVVNFILTSDLYNNGDPQYLDFTHGDEETIVHAKAIDKTHPNRCLVGGRPYIIQAYKRLGETISGQNLGLKIMTQYADKFDESASCINNGLYEQLTNREGESLKTLQFAIPYEQHKVQAIRRGGDAQPLTYDDGDGDKKYYYTMVGQYWEQDLPLYCIYMSGHAWYRYTGKYGTYKWAPYKCIIMPSQEIDERGGGYRDDFRSQIPNVSGTDLLDKEFKLGFLDGRNDDDFKTNGAKYTFTFDDGITQFDENGNLMTAIKQLDGEDLTVGSGDGKVYNMSGQQVGKSINGLGKGLYIVNGKKVVVK